MSRRVCVFSSSLFACIRVHPWQKGGFPMRVNRAYVDGTLAVGARVALPEDAAAHLLRVLRLDVGDGCVLFNGAGHDYDARVVAAGQRGGAVGVTGMPPVDLASPPRQVLVPGNTRREQMD